MFAFGVSRKMVVPFFKFCIFFNAYFNSLWRVFRKKVGNGILF